jgi:UDP-2-acetamido-2-deoxy-ribo-hexuluronate aminotransferase
MPGGGNKILAMLPIKMVDLHGQYLHIKKDVDEAIQRVLNNSDFIQGEDVRKFESQLSNYLGGIHVISCGNGTDALQIAMMALNFKAGDEIILPVFTYVATAEVIALLGLVPVFADVEENSFNLDISKVERLITKRTVAIVPVHLFGQCAAMEPLLAIGKKYNLHIIEDAAQALGSQYTFGDGSRKCAGTMGVMGSTSFFPTKNLGAFGDGGALFTDDPELAERLRMISTHGQKIKYHHEIVGVNSRLDTLQAAILSVKLQVLNDYELKRRKVADFYDVHLKDIPFVKVPVRMKYSTHVFHQYTITTNDIKRDALKSYLQEKGIPSIVFYPQPLHKQPAYQRDGIEKGAFPISERLSDSVLSLPIHTEINSEQLSYICDSIRNFR